MRKRFHAVITLALVCFLCGCANQQGIGSTLNESDTAPTESVQNTAENEMKESVSNAEGETKPEPAFVPDSFVMIDNRPFMLRDGAAYCWTENNQWERYGDWENLVRLYREEYFVALDSEGKIICEDYPDAGEEGMENMPLGSGYVLDMKGRMLELNQEYAVKALNKGGGEDWRALLEDNRLMVSMAVQEGDYAYQEVSIDGEKIVDISGSFALTESGKVYKGTINCRTVARGKNENGVMERGIEEWFVWEQLDTDKSITAIYASETSGICVGLREDGTAVRWSIVKNSWQMKLDLSEWEDVSEVAVGFNYIVGLTASGEVLYADPDEEMETKVKQLLQEKKHTVRIACAFQTIALLNQDGTVEMIHLDD